MKSACIVNYNHSPSDWWLNYGYEPQNVTVYDRSDDGVAHTFAAKTIKTQNVGNVDRDKLAYLIENYYNLPETFLWCKSNIFKYVYPEQLKAAIEKNEFTPLLKHDHKTYSDNSLPGGNPVCFYDSSGIYYERKGIVNTLHTVLPWHHYKQIEDFWADFDIKPVGYIPFGPGGNFILTKEKVHKYGVDYYQRMFDLIGYAQTPLEAQFLERSYLLLWQ